MIRNCDGTRLFAADAGRDQISVVHIDDGKLLFAGAFFSGGAGPVSLTYQDSLLYVLNDGQLPSIDRPVLDHQIAHCLMVITKDGRFAYTSNA